MAKIVNVCSVGDLMHLLAGYSAGTPLTAWIEAYMRAEAGTDVTDRDNVLSIVVGDIN